MSKKQLVSIVFHNKACTRTTKRKVGENDRFTVSRLSREINNIFLYRSSGYDVRAHGFALGNDQQVIVGEHEELPEADLNEGTMTADPEIEKLLETGNMEQLAALVLNGEGRRLVGRHSGNTELQAFIDRVPSYMVIVKEYYSPRFVSINESRYIYIYISY